MAWVFEYSEMSGVARCVLLVIANYIGDHEGDEYCWPSIERIAREARCSERGARNAIRTAEAAGELITELGASKTGTNIYRMPRRSSGRGAESAGGQNGGRKLPPNHKEPLVLKPRSKSAAPHGAIVDNRPDHDQTYLDEKIADHWEHSPIGVKGLQRLNNQYGRAAVTDALRSLHGFPPETLSTAFGYVAKVCKDRAVSA